MQIGRGRFEAASAFDVCLANAQKNAELWRAVYRTASVDDEAVRRLKDLAPHWRLLALSEDWCTDAVSVLPVLARLAERAGVELRVLGRDDNPDIMDAHLTCGTRSIPVVMAIDADFVVRAWWGPRPAVMQRWMRTEGIWLPKEDRTRRKRAWYARDRGRSAVTEVIEMVERAERRRREQAAGSGSVR